MPDGMAPKKAGVVTVTPYNSDTYHVRGAYFAAHGYVYALVDVFFFSSRRRHTRFDCVWSSDVCSSDLAYEAMKVALAAIERAGSKDRAAIRDAIFATRNYDGILGTWSFTPTGDTTLTRIDRKSVV